MRKRRVRELLRRNIGVIVMIWIMEILVISGGMITLGMIGGGGSIDEVVCVNDSWMGSGDAGRCEEGELYIISEYPRGGGSVFLV